MPRPIPILVILLAAALGLPAAAAAAAAAAPCPAPTAAGTTRLAFAPVQLVRPHYSDVIAGGRVELAACSGVPGHGRVTPGPDFAVELAEDAPGRELEFRTAGACDTVLLVTTDGATWHFDDDGAGAEHARLRLPAAAGRYHVWVGTYAAASCRARLIVETFPAAAPGS